MATKKLVALRLDMDLIAGLELVKAQTGTPVAEQVRRLLRDHLREVGAIRPTRIDAASVGAFGGRRGRDVQPPRDRSRTPKRRKRGASGKGTK